MKNIKTLRKRRQLTQQQLADTLGIQQQSLCKYELGISEISLHLLKKLSNFFRVPLDVIINDNVNVEHYFESINKNIKNKEFRLIQMYRRLNQENKIRLTTFLEDLHLAQTGWQMTVTVGSEDQD